MSEALGKIRAALKGHDLLGAEAIELKPGAVVLVVLRHPVHTSAIAVDDLRKTAGEIAKILQGERIGACAVVLPEGFALDVIEVST